MCCRCGGGGGALFSVNPFRVCKGLRVLGYLMLPLVAAMAGLVYYAVVVAVWGPRVAKHGRFSALALSVVIFFHLLVIDVFLRWITIVYGLSIVWELVYTFLETALSSLALLPHFISFFSEASRHINSAENLSIIFIASILSAAFALSLLCFISMHVSLVLTNTTSIEIYEEKNLGFWRYDLGNFKNFEQVFGTKKWLWFFPLYSTEDLENLSTLHGLEFPTRANVV